MASTAEQIVANKQRIDGLQARLIGIAPPGALYALAGAYCAFGCKVTEGTSAADFEVALEGQAAGDSAHLNPDLSITPTRGFQYPNVALVADGGFYSTDLTTEVAAAPTTGLARYDIAYIYSGVAGPGFAIAQGTPSEAVKTDFTTNGLRTTPYDPGTDAALPVGALAVARIYIADTSTGIANAQIADIRDFEGRLKGDALTWDDLTPTQKDELIDPAVAAATAAVLADNEEFKREMRTLFWLGI